MISLFWLVAPPASAATLQVCDVCAYSTIGEALPFASFGDTIEVLAGLYDETDLTVDFDLTISGAGADVTTLRSASAQVIAIDGATVTISGVDLEPTTGRGARVDGGRTTLSGVTVTGVTGTLDGLGVYVTAGGLTIEGCTFEDLVTTGSGGAIAILSGTLDSSASTFRRNEAIAGGAIYSDTDVTSAGDLFASNVASGEGGAIRIGFEMEVDVDGSTFQANQAAIGGAIAADDYRSKVTLAGASFIDDTASDVGGDVYGHALEAVDTTFTGSWAPKGAAIYVGQDLALTRVTVSDITSTGSTVQAYYARSSVTDCLFEDIAGIGLYLSEAGHYDWYPVANTSFRRVGTGAYVQFSGVTFDGCTFEDNAVGVAIGTTAVASVTRSTFTGHTSAAAALYESQATFSDCLFADNAGTNGAAIAMNWIYSAKVHDCTFVRNAASSGGAIHTQQVNGDVLLADNTFCDNAADDGAHVWATYTAWTTYSLELVGNTFSDGVASANGAGLHLQADAVVSNNAFLGGSAAAGGAVWSDHALDFRSNIVAWNGAYGLYGGGGSAVIEANAFWENDPDAVGGTWSAPDATNLAVDPRILAYAPGDCDTVDAGLASDSPLLGAGHLGQDIGPSGSSFSDDRVLCYVDADDDGHGAPGEGVLYTTCWDGYAASDDDCDDADAAIHPGMTELCDGVDQDCDGALDDGVMPTWYPDDDGDSWGRTADAIEVCSAPGHSLGGEDCDDTDRAVHPGATEIPGDGIDQDCQDGDEPAPDPEDPDTAPDGGPKGCRGCDSTTTSGWLAWVGAALLARRRRTSRN